MEEQHNAAFHQTPEAAQVAQAKKSADTQSKTSEEASPPRKKAAYAQASAGGAAVAASAGHPLSLEWPEEMQRVDFVNATPLPKEHFPLKKLWGYGDNRPLFVQLGFFQPTGDTSTPRNAISFRRSRVSHLYDTVVPVEYGYQLKDAIKSTFQDRHVGQAHPIHVGDPDGHFYYRIYNSKKDFRSNDKAYGLTITRYYTSGKQYILDINNGVVEEMLQFLDHELTKAHQYLRESNY